MGWSDGVPLALPIGVVLASFAEQFLRRKFLPGMGKIGAGRWSHIDVQLAVFAHELPWTAEHPDE